MTASPTPTVSAAPTPSTTATPIASAVLELQDVSRWYGNVVAVNDISFALGPGVTGLLGPNGAGKSTLINMMAGLLRPSAGRVLVEGRAAWGDPSIYRSIGLVPEREAVHPYLTGYEFALYSARLQRLPDPAGAAARAIETVDLADARDRPIGTYSKGMRQRLHMIELLREMAAAGRTILFSSHILEEVERLAENVLVIYAGRLAASGDFREIRRLMTDRPHSFTIRSSDDRRLGAALVANEAVFGVELVDGALSIRSSDFAAFTRLLPTTARQLGVSLFELRPTDESLESVFSYLVRR